MDCTLIEMSDNEDEYNSEDNKTTIQNESNNEDKQDNNVNNKSDELNSGKNDKDEIIYIQKDNIESDDPLIMKFVAFCIKKRLFDDTFYDFGNKFSIVATKLPTTFDLMSKDGNSIKKEEFVKYFTKQKFKDDLEHIFDSMDDGNKGYVTWEDFIEFFVPFVKNVTI